MQDNVVWILYLYSHKKCYSLPGISEKVDITKTEFYKYVTSGVTTFNITSVYLIEFIMD